MRYGLAFLALGLLPAPAAWAQVPTDPAEAARREGIVKKTGDAKGGDDGKSDEDPTKKAATTSAPEDGSDYFDWSTVDEESRIRIFRDMQRRRMEGRRLEERIGRSAERLSKVQSDLHARYKALRVVQEEMAAEIERQRKSAEEAVPEDEQRRLEVAAKEEREAKVKRLAKVFDKMKAADAAKVVPEMSESLAVDVLSLVKDRQAGKILGQLEPRLAARISEKMAAVKKGRRR
jgi:flagellar motility protein MotE (MotC chaperone)